MKRLEERRGSAGVVGSQVAARLAQRGVPQRLVVRDVSRAAMVAGADVIRAPSYGLAGGTFLFTDRLNFLFPASSGICLQTKEW